MSACTHLEQVEVLAPDGDVAGCEECIESGMRWVHLRMCQTCGRIGCCDNSPGRHATTHHKSSEQIGAMAVALAHTRLTELAEAESV